ncbi:MAG: alpha-N-arabinofuranosidase [Candidatus Nealsonbacteria bacterium]|nr:alpha-N-arabinofuranosidase [Candidatus Nealsonbacteria bacterium]
MKRAVISSITVVLLVAICILAQPVCAVAAEKDAEKELPNLMPNGSFEKAADGKPLAWATQIWGGKGTFDYADQGRTGKRCVAISSEDGADIGWAVTVPLELYSKYRLSAWIKTENVKTKGQARGALLNLHNNQPLATKAITGTTDWTRVELVFDSNERDAIQVNCLFGGWGLATGKAWYDDLKLEQLTRGSWEPKLAIDVTKTGEPISKYIYGQFIEHLGRCIYGGIWAEMLEDRKFAFPITPEYKPYRPARGVAAGTGFPVVAASPWQIVGAGDSVKMVKDDSFVGDHTPQVEVGSGIRQLDLGLIKGKEYVGYVWLKPARETVTIEVTLRWGDGPKEMDRETITNATNRYQQCSLDFTSGADTNQGILEIKVTAGNPGLIGTVSLMPADNIKGMRADTMALLKQLDSPVYRWPGGNFVSGYNWKDGIGPRDRRPPRQNPAWTGVEHNDFGLDEFMDFCRILKTEPYIAVNSGLGGVENAVQELQYSNGAADTPMGKLRAQNGHPEPYKVKWWGIGNEMYGGWQLGHMSLEDYVKKHNVFADAMRAEDKSIKLVAVGDAGRWSEVMMQQCAGHMELISEHFYRQGNPGLAAHVLSIPDAVRHKADAHRDYRERFDALKGKDIRIALDEWNFWYGPHVFGELGTRYFLKDGLGIAAGLNEYARQSDIIFMANYAQTVNVIGCIKTSKTAASFATTGLMLKLYRKHFGVIPVATTAGRPLDVMAALTEDRKALTIAVVNPTMQAIDIPLDLQGAKLTGSGRRYEMSGPDPLAYNEPGKPPKVTVEESTVSGVSDKLSVAPCSVTLFALPLR